VVVIDTQIGGAALETQTMPLYERDMVTGDRQNEEIWAHELGHQWWGDSVSLKRWKDIWLNEGAATYSEWLWREKEQGRDALEAVAQRTHQRLEANGIIDFANPDNEAELKAVRRRPIGDPTASGLFSERVYMQGGLTMHALRLTVGDEAFFKTLQTYQARFKGQSAGTEDFQQVAEEISGKNLQQFFQDWLYSGNLPDLPPRSA
jgi:aminopeptidase N